MLHIVLLKRGWLLARIFPSSDLFPQFKSEIKKCTLLTAFQR
jgi:hypothetical protein